MRTCFGIFFLFLGGIFFFGLFALCLLSFQLTWCGWVVFLWWCGSAFMFLWWCFCGGVVVFLCFCGGVFVVVF